MTVDTSKPVASKERIAFARPPLTEAVIEFHFDPDTIAWTEDHLDRITEIVKQDLPLSDDVTHETVEPIGGPTSRVARHPARRFSTEQKGIRLTVGHAMIGQSLLPKGLRSGYPGWDELFGFAELALSVYEQIVESTAVQLVRVRYINQIPVLSGEFRLTSFVAPNCTLIPPVLRAERNPFRLELSRSTTANETEAQQETVLLAAGVTEGGSEELLFRIDEIAFSAPTLSLKDPSAACRQLHEAALQTFLTVLHPELLKSFEPIPSPNRQ